MIKAVVTGAAGRMGSRIINVLASSEGIRLSGAVERKGHAMVGQDSCGPAGLPSGAVLNLITDDLTAALKAGDVLIDFTTPKVSLKNLEVCGLKKKAIVIGSTGFTAEERRRIVQIVCEQAAGRVPVRRPDNDLKGLAPAPGWLAKYDWTGFIPFDELPQSFNPPNGEIVTANNKIAPPGYQRWITSGWQPPYRAERIDALLARVREHSVASFERVQAEFDSLRARLSE